MKPEFDANEYFLRLCRENRLCQELEFRPCYCSGIGGMEAVLAQFQTTANFIMVDDITAAGTHEQPDGFYERQTYTVFILMRYRHGDMRDYNEKIRTCRLIYHQFLSRILRDQDEEREPFIETLITSNILSTELGRDAFTGLTGMYFHIDNDEPLDIVYCQQDWV